jgi:hypothetical protein
MYIKAPFGWKESIVDKDPDDTLDEETIEYLDKTRLFVLRNRDNLLIARLIYYKEEYHYNKKGQGTLELFRPTLSYDLGIYDSLMSVITKANGIILNNTQKQIDFYSNLLQEVNHVTGSNKRES